MSDKDDKDDGEITEFKKKFRKADDDGNPMGAVAVTLERCDNGWIVRIAKFEEEVGDIAESASVFTFDQKGLMFGFIDKSL